uniref:Uncharacterized protein n=1 Tax=Pipistrellus kuhlii TaxID=59472 RepID=A0A7J7VMR4_PIPKU|nr:hypothetical protein mPipKuh1_008434 [Pipistrellus kuhlii]
MSKAPRKVPTPTSELQGTHHGPWGSWRDWLMPMFLHILSTACSLERWSLWRKGQPLPLGMKMGSWSPRVFPMTISVRAAEPKLNSLGEVTCEVEREWALGSDRNGSESHLHILEAMTFLAGLLH